MAKIKCDMENITLEGDYGEVESVCVICSKCGHQTESFGTSERSIRRYLALLNEECPRGEDNFYVVMED